MENVSRAQTSDRQIFALVLLLERLSAQISAELLSCVCVCVGVSLSLSPLSSSF